MNPQFHSFQKLLQIVPTFFLGLHLSQYILKGLKGIYNHWANFCYTKIKIYKFFDCKRHLFKLLRILANEKILSIFI